MERSVALVVALTVAGCSCGPMPSIVADAGRTDAWVPPRIDSGPARPCSAFTVIPATAEPTRTYFPSRVSAFFRVLCGEQGVSGLNFDNANPDNSNFVLLEDSIPVSVFESRGIVVPDPERFQLLSLLLIDLSGSITESPGGIDEVKAAVRAYIDAINAAGRPHPVAIYSFDGRETLQPIATFGLTDAVRDAAIAMLTCDRTRYCVDPSTNLNGAVVSGLDLLDAQRATVDPAVGLIESFLVVFSDGTDQAGRVPFDDVRAALGLSRSRVFSVGIEGEPGEETLVSIGRDGYRSGRSVEELSEAFQGVATLVSDLANSYYQVDYCSPKRDGVHDLTVLVQRDGMTGQTSADFDATGFTYGCISDPDTCPYGRADCDRDGMVCEVDLASDVAHCGGCGIACGAGLACIEGRCAPLCLSTEIFCDGACYDPMTSADHCGGCGNACDPHESCAGGMCLCDAPSMVCDGACVDPSSDPSHCGGCDRACGFGQACALGTCGCVDPTATYCSDACLLCGADTPHCGSAGPSRCCSPSSVFCDTPGVGTACWAGGTDCSTVSLCGGSSWACPSGGVPNCGADGRFYCCNSDFPDFCDPAVYGRPEPCWSCGPGFRTDCATLTCVP